MRTHIVQKGETLWRIAKHYGIGLDELKRLNAHLANPDYIVPGMEIVLPDTATAGTAGTGTGTKTTMTKEQLTAPVAPAAPVAPVPPKVVETAPKEVMTKEQLTAPVKEVPKAIETAPIPAPMPAPVPPQFNFDFAPQMHFPQPQMQPQPMPMPMPQPQPIFIELPQQPMPMPQQVQQVQQVVEVEKEVEKEIEYVPVPQQHIVYVPYILHPQPHQHCHKPCRCKHHFHHKPPCRREQPMFDYSAFCGCHEPQPVNYDCGCQGGGYDQQMMPFNMQYFEPNYDISPVMDTSYPEDEGLPDWLIDSSSSDTGEVEGLSQYVMPEHNEDFDQDTNVAGVTDYPQDMYNYDYGVHPTHAYYGTHQVMPQQMMPYAMPHQQAMYPNCHKPNMNPYSSHYTPWKY